MLSKIVLALACMCAAQALAAGDAEQNHDVSNLEEAVLSRSARSTCGYDSCNSFCRKLGHARGVCIGSYCQCRFQRKRRSALPVETIDVANSEDTVLSRSARATCGYDSCNSFCRKQGHARGVCIGSYCQCRFQRKRRSPLPVETIENDEHVDLNVLEDVDQPDVKEQPFGVPSFADVVLSRQRRSCGAGECNAHCKKLGHAHGVCIGTYCQCRSI